MLFSNLNNLTAPSGMFCTPDSHRANVRGETSTCRAAFARDRLRDLRSAFSSGAIIFYSGYAIFINAPSSVICSSEPPRYLATHFLSSFLRLIWIKAPSLKNKVIVSVKPKTDSRKVTCSGVAPISPTAPLAISKWKSKCFPHNFFRAGVFLSFFLDFIGASFLNRHGGMPRLRNKAMPIWHRCQA